MLDDDEYNRITDLFYDSREKLGTKDRPEDMSPVDYWAREALDEYERITGYRETVFNAVMHHRISDYGPPCKNCGK